MESTRCPSCGGTLERGTLRARNADSLSGVKEAFRVVSEFSFVRPGIPTSSNPVAAFLQGVREEPGDQPLPLIAFRCSECGRVELYAADQ